MEDLKLLDELVALNGLPLEVKGQKIKASLKISDEMKMKVETITKPYIMLVGEKNLAINLAAYIYLNKNCSVYSDVYLHEEHKKAAASLLRKAKRGESVYLELFHYKGDTGDITEHTYCKYVNKKTGRHSSPAFSIDNYYYALVRADFYHKDKREKPADVKKKLIEIIYQNHFRYVGREDSRLGKLNTLEMLDKGEASMAYDEMLRFKNTVFLIDFMHGVRDEADINCKEFRDFTDKLDTLRKGMPGFLIIHIDSKKNWPKGFLKQFDVIKLGAPKTAQARSAGTKKSTDKKLRKDSEPHKKILNDTLEEYIKPDQEYLSLRCLANKVFRIVKEYNKVEKSNGKEGTLLFEYEPNSIETHIQKHELYPDVQEKFKNK